MKRTILLGLMVTSFTAYTTYAQPALDGSISGSEGWTLLSENPYAGPAGGGSSTASDLIGESASFNWWDGINSQNQTWNDNRADIINVHVGYDSTYLYLGVAGPTLPFNSFTDAGNGGNNDMGDLFIAIDMAGGAASGNLNANEGHSGFDTEGVRAVDFEGWRPTHILGVQYVDNGGGGGGWANLFDTDASSMVQSAGQGGAGDFAWNAGINSSAAYDTVNQNAGEFEFRIAWSVLGITEGPPVFQSMRFAAYTTANFGGSDVFDSGPGTGQNTVHEEIGDTVGDVDRIGDDLFLLAADAGIIPPGAAPGANYVDPNVWNYGAAPNRYDEIDTIAEYYTFVIVPEPASLALILTGLGLISLRRRRM